MLWSINYENCEHNFFYILINYSYMGHVRNNYIKNNNISNYFAIQLFYYPIISNIFDKYK